MSPHKPKDEDEEDTSNVNEFHGHPLLVKTDMTEEMAYDVSIYRETYYSRKRILYMPISNRLHFIL